MPSYREGAISTVRSLRTGRNQPQDPAKRFARNDPLPTAVARIRSLRHPVPSISASSGADQEMPDALCESLADALTRVLATGASLSEAQTDICAAISAADIRIWWRTEKIDKDGRILFSALRRFWAPFLKVLFPEDFDWEKSLFKGRLERENYSVSPFRRLQIELSIKDVQRLCFEVKAKQLGLEEASSASRGFTPNTTDGAPLGHETLGPATQQAPTPLNPDNATRPARRRARPSSDSAVLALASLYPAGVPNQEQVRNAALCERVSKYLDQNKMEKVSDDSILRADRTA